MKRLNILGLAIGAFLVSVASLVNAQQTPAYNSNYENPWLFNPANIRHYESTTASLIYRNQWVGFDGAPKVSVLGLNGRFNEKHAMGFKLMHDQSNIVTQVNTMLSYAYMAKINDKHELVFALSGGISNYSVDFNKVVAGEVDDEALLTQATNKASADFDLGIQYQTGNLKLGLAAFQLLGNGIELKQQEQFRETTYRKLRHFSLNASYEYEFGDAMSLEPLVVARSVQGMDFHADVNLRLKYDDLLWGGVMYRTTGSVAALAGANLFNTVGVGYSFEYPLAVNYKHAGATHEMYLTYRFNKKSANGSVGSDAKRHNKSKKAMAKLQKQNAEQYEQIDQLNQQIELLSREISELRKSNQSNDSLQQLQEEKMQKLLENELKRMELQKQTGTPSKENENNQQSFEEAKEELIEKRKQREQKREEELQDLGAYLNSLKQQKPVSGKSQYLVLGSFYKESQAKNYQNELRQKLNLESLVVASDNGGYYYLCSRHVNDLNQAVSEVEANYKSYQINGRPWVYLGE